MDDLVFYIVYGNKIKFFECEGKIEYNWYKNNIDYVNCNLSLLLIICYRIGCNGIMILDRVW